MVLEIRGIDASDAQTAQELIKSAYEPLLQKYNDYEQSPACKTVERVAADIARSDTDAYLLICDSEAIGYVRVVKRGESEYGVSDLCVKPSMQGRGYAQQLLIDLEGMYPQARRWSLVTVMEEKRDCHLYEKLGYSRVGEPIYVNEAMHLVKYEKSVE